MNPPVRCPKVRPLATIDGHNPVEEPAASVVEAEAKGHEPDAPGEFPGSGTPEAHEASTSEPTAESGPTTARRC